MCTDGLTKWGFTLPFLPELDLQWEIQRKIFFSYSARTIVEKPIIMHKGIYGGCDYTCKRVPYYRKLTPKLIKVIEILEYDSN